IEELATLVGGRRDPGEVADTLEAVLRLSGKDAGGWQMAVRKGLAEGMQRRGVQLADFLRELPASRRELAARMEERPAPAVARAGEGAGGGPERPLAIRRLAQADWRTAGPVLDKLVRQEPDAAARLAAVRALASFPEAKVGQLLADAWTGAPPAVR